MLKKLILLLAILPLAGCFKPVSLPSVHTYSVNTSSDQRISRYPNLVSIQVLNPTSASYYISNKMYYQLKPHNLQSFTVNRWLAPPNQMLLPLITQSLINSNYYHAVIAAPSSVQTRYRLDTRLIDFYQDFTTNPSQMIISLQTTLINNQTGKIVASKEFRATAPAPSNDPYGGVIAANAATQEILAEVVRFVTSNS